MYFSKPKFTLQKSKHDFLLVQDWDVPKSLLKKSLVSKHVDFITRMKK